MNENVVTNWLDVTIVSLENLWADMLGLLPDLIGALVILIIGLTVASVVGSLVEHVVRYLKLDTLLKKADVEAHFKRAGISLNTGHFLGRLVYWFVVVAFLLAASEILKFVAFSQFLNVILGFIPRVIVAVLMLAATMIVAQFLRNLVVASASSAKLNFANGLGLIVWWIIFIFGLLATFEQVGINVAIINTLVTGLIAMLALAGGLAFGLGGKEHASRFIGQLGKEMKKD